ncbi:MAG TPA: hypothetical protein DET40_01995 [Lentisphaeria bacterium]|nr:hypothetical protein [Lentisphaeria bacterium]
MTDKEKALQDLEIAKAKLATIAINKRAEILQTYDAVDSRNTKKRRQATIETEDESKQMSQQEGLQATALARNLQRNYTVAKSHLNQLKLQTIGTGAKLVINSEDEATAKAVAWYNGAYSKSCDSRDDTPMGELQGQIIETVIREGNVIVALDDFDEDDGKLIFWESDQFATIEKSAWEKTDLFKAGYKQDRGIITSKKGRVYGYAVGSERGKTSYKDGEYTILTRDQAKLLKNPFRLNQKLGISGILTAATSYQDIHEGIQSELQTMKLFSKRAGQVVKDPNYAGTSVEEDILLNSGVDPEAIIDGTEATPTPAEPSDNYDKIEAYCGGLVDYMQSGEKFEPIDSGNRPNLSLKEFSDWVNIMAGGSLGLYDCYSTNTVNTSYTAFRGAMMLTNPTFKFWAKWLERRFLDWVAVKAINWAISKGKLQALPEGWENRIMFLFPEQEDINPLDAANARSAMLKNAQTTFSKQLGPQWKSKLIQLAEETKFIKEIGLDWLGIFETKSGAPTTAQPDASQPNKGSDDETDQKTFIQKLKTRFFHGKN